MQIAESERKTYESAWAVPAYTDNSPGEQWLPLFLDMAKPEESLRSYAHWNLKRRATVLDAGCGAGKGALALRAHGFDVTMCDLTPVGLLPEAADLRFVETELWANVLDRVGKHDWVYCCDVLEHLPTPFTMLAISRLLDVARYGAFLSISLMPDAFGAWVGKPLHQSVQTFVQWRDQIDAVGRLRECRDLLHTGLYLVEGRC